MRDGVITEADTCREFVTPLRAESRDEYQTKDFERVVALRSRTRAMARHLTDLLKGTDRFAKTLVFCVDQELMVQVTDPRLGETVLDPACGTAGFLVEASGHIFERGGPTDTLWYYELPLPEGRKKYSKTASLQFEEFAPALAWWNAREEGPQAWKVDFAAKSAQAEGEALVAEVQA